MVFGELKAWLLGNAVMILGVALALTAGYALVLQFVVVPYHKNEKRAAELARDEWKLATEGAVGANRDLAKGVDRCNASVDGLKISGDQTALDVGAILQTLGKIDKNTRSALGAYKPDPNKSACQNAMDELAQFKKERGR